MGLGAFTEGLTSGLTTGMNIKNAKRYADIYQQYADQNAEELRLKKEEQDKAPKIEDFFSGLADIADGGATPIQVNASPDPQSVVLKPLTERPGYGMGIKGYAQGGLVGLDNGAFAGGMPPSSAGLSAVAPQQPQPQQAQAAPPENLTPQQRLTKAMLTTDLLSNPDKLSKLAAFADMHGMGKTITPWLERAYTAKKSGMIDGAMQLMRGQVDDAIDSLAKGGIKLADRPKLADPTNPRLWKINIEGAGEKTMDVSDLLQSTLEPKDFLKQDLAKSESQGKRNVSDSRVRVNDSQARANDARVKVSNAQVGKLGAETRNVGKDGSPSGGTGKALRVSKTLQTNEGIVAVMSDGTHRTLHGKDGKPIFGTDNMKIAAGLVGKTIDPYGDNANLAGKVNDMAGQLGGSTTPPPQAPANKIRKFNPQTGKFD